MDPAILVLVNASATAEQAARYAAVLGAPLHARLTLLNLTTYPVIMSPEMVEAEAQMTERIQAETLHALQSLARQLPVPAEVEELPGVMLDAVEVAVRQHHPLLLAMGLSAEHGLFDHLLHNQVLPVLRATHWPLLLVPEGAPDPALPRRVLVAVDADPFTPNAATRHLVPLFRAWPAGYTVAHVAPNDGERKLEGHLALAEVRASMLLPPHVVLELREISSLDDPAVGILQAMQETQADLLLLIARPRSFLGRLFHRSVTAQVLQYCRKPLLLLPVEEIE